MTASPSVDPSVALYARRPELPAPVGHLFASACWLVARHPVLHRLACRVPGAVDTDSDVLPWVLADALAAYDTATAAWQQYRKTRPEPRWRDGETDAAYEAWEAAGPQTPDEHRAQVHALGVMSRTEVVRLRLLAAFSDDTPVSLSVGMLTGLDAEGDELVTDWMVAIQAYRGHR